MVDVFDPTNLQKLGSIPVAEESDAILYDPSNKLIYVANKDGALATLIDPDTRTSIGTIPLPGKPELYQRVWEVASEFKFLRNLRGDE